MDILSDPFAAPISNRRPLLGITILLIEDSRYCSEGVRLMTMRSGARLRRADCLKSARKHLAIYRPDLVIVDLGLPDGSGLEIITEICDQSADHPAILAISGDIDAGARAQALASGAQGFLPKPLGNVKHFQSVVENLVRQSDQTIGFFPQEAGSELDLDQQALFDDLGRIEKILEAALPNEDHGQLRYCAQFVSSVAQTARDVELMEGAKKFFARLDMGSAGVRSGKDMLAILQQRLRHAKTYAKEDAA